MNVTVVGAGPAGMMSAIAAASRGKKVTLMEKNDRLGKKLAITGGGRCNLTYATDTESLIQHVVNNPSFLYSAFYTFGSESLMRFFEGRGISLKTEEGRVFPQSERARDIIKVLEDALKEYKVQVMLNHPVRDISQILKQGGKVIVATGGLSYPDTGSTGDGYRWAKQLGHAVVDMRPSLVPLHGDALGLAGLSLKSVKLTINNYSKVGNLIFTHRGLSGPVVLEASQHFRPGMTVTIDLMPYLSQNELDKLLIKLFKRYPNKSVGNLLSGTLPKRLVPFLLETPLVKANFFTKKSRSSLVKIIKNFKFNAKAAGGFNEAIITAGGVDVRQINPSDMSSKKVSGLYFAGEVLDVDALTGGFNLQIAFSTGYAAGCSV